VTRTTFFINNANITDKMKLTLQYHNVRSTGGIETLVENMVLSLQPALKIDEAIVRLEQSSEGSPRFRTFVHLVTPGPDVIAEGRDHTLLAAINKVIASLKEKIGHRAMKRLRQFRGNMKHTTSGVNFH
jgi:ribosome-associated translation inhibitor RaiA